MNTANFKIDKWLKELHALQDDVVYLKKNNEDFLALAKKWNEKKLDGELWNFAKKNYISYMSMAIRRFCDDHKDAVSLWKLISGINLNAAAVTRAWFLEEWSGGEHESLFKEFFDASATLQTDTVSKHLADLESITKSIRDRADKVEAHKDKKPTPDTEPTFNDIDKSVQIICDLYTKYYYLLKQRSLSL